MVLKEYGRFFKKKSVEEKCLTEADLPVQLLSEVAQILEPAWLVPFV